MLPARSVTRLRHALAEDERVLWVGRPIRNIYRHDGMRVVAPACGFMGMALLTLAATQALDIDPVVRLLGPGAVATPVAGVIMILFWWPFSFPKLRSIRTVYAITNRRAIVIAGTVFGAPRAQSFRELDLNAVYTRERADGSGDLILREATLQFGEGYGETVREGFFDVRSVREAEAILRRALAGRDD